MPNHFRVYINSVNHNCYFTVKGLEQEVLKLVTSIADNNTTDIDVLIKYYGEWRLFWEISPGKCRIV